MKRRWVAAGSSRNWDTRLARARVIKASPSLKKNLTLRPLYERARDCSLSKDVANSADICPPKHGVATTRLTGAVAEEGSAAGCCTARSEAGMADIKDNRSRTRGVGNMSLANSE